jgi:plastocyanin
MMTLSTTFAVLIALFALLTTTTIISVSVSAAETIMVDNWYIPPYRGPKTLDAKVGDTIVFEWDSGHNVYIHPTMNCLTNGAIFVGSDSPALYTFAEADAGTDMFFACEIGDRSHCNSGKYNCTNAIVIVIVIVIVVVVVIVVVINK